MEESGKKFSRGQITPGLHQARVDCTSSWAMEKKCCCSNTAGSGWYVPGNTIWRRKVAMFKAQGREEATGTTKVMMWRRGH